MSRIILVHGAWHGGWCWQHLVPFLENQHSVSAPDLPGLGSDTTPINRVSLGRYVEKIAALLTASDEPAVVVGHSMGGVVTSQLAEEYPELIQRLIYLCAFLPQDGEALIDKNGTDNSLLNEHKTIDQENLTLSIDPAHLRAVFYHDCDPELARWAQNQLVDQPLAPLGTPLKLSAERFGSVPKDGIVCLQDRAITPELQRQMYLDGQCDEIFELDSGHSPFLSMPEQLAKLLLNRIV